MARRYLKRGVFITFEGFEGSGKSTQISLLAAYLKKKGLDVLLLREPGSTRLGESLRKLLLNKKNGFIGYKAELLLYLCARAQLVSEKIIPALKQKKVVLCDRFQDATIAYQGYGLGIDKEKISSFGEFVTGGITADLTVLLDISVKKGLERAGCIKDRIECRPTAYHNRVRKGYLDIALRSAYRVRLIKVKGINKTQEEIRKVVLEYLCL